MRENCVAVLNESKRAIEINKIVYGYSIFRINLKRYYKMRVQENFRRDILSFV